MTDVIKIEAADPHAAPLEKPDSIAPFSPEDFPALESGVPARRAVDALAEINNLLLAPETPQALFSGIATVNAEAFGYPLVSIALLDDEMGYLEVAGVNIGGAGEMVRRYARRMSFRTRFELSAITTAPWLSAILNGFSYTTMRPEELGEAFLPPTRTRAMIRLLGLKLGIVVPLMARGKLLGALAIGSDRMELAPGEQSDLILVAQHTALALAMWRLFDRSEGRTAVLNKLHTLTQTIAGTLDLDRLYSEVASAAGQLANIDFCTVNALTPDGKAYLNHAAWGEGARAEKMDGLRPADILPAPVVQQGYEGKPVLIPDLSCYPEANQALRHRSAGAIAMFPFRLHSSVVGFITVGRDQPGEWHDDDVRVLKQLSDYVTVAYTNAHLYSEARRRAAEQSALAGSARLIARAENDKVLQEIVEAGSALMMNSRCSLYLPNDAGDLANVAVFGEHADLVRGTILQRKHGLIAEVYENGQPVISGDVQQTGELEQGDAAERLGVRSCMAVPLQTEHERVGVLVAASARRNLYSTAQLELLATLADHATIAIENGRLLREAEKKAAEQEALAESAHAIARLDIKTVLNTIVGKASKIVKSSRCSLFLYDAGTDELYWAAGYHSPPGLQSMRLKTGEGVTGHIFASGEGLLLADIMDDPRSVWHDLERDNPVRSFMGVPLKGPTGIIGVLVTAHHDPGVFARRDLDILATFADHATIALSNAHLYNSLQQRERERTRLLHQLLTSQEAERRRVAVDIHDGPLQSIGVNLLAMDRMTKHLHDGRIEHALRELDEVRAGMTAVVQELRDVITELRPSLLETQGLLVAIEAHLNSFRAQYSINTSLRDNLHGKRVPATLEITFYRIMQEALTNVRKHANASEVWIELGIEDDTLRMSVIDNGQGFDPELRMASALAGGHIGLHSMWERLDLIGGGMTLKSTPGTGTNITFWASVSDTAAV